MKSIKPKSSNRIAPPLRPRCDRPDFKRIAFALDQAKGPLSRVYQSEYRYYCRFAATPYSFHPFCQQFKLWQKVRRNKDLEKAAKEIDEYDASEDYWRSVGAPKGRSIIILAAHLVALSVKGGELRLWEGGIPGHQPGLETWITPGGRMPAAIAFTAWGGTISIEAARFCNRHNIGLVFMDGPDLVNFAVASPITSAALIRRQANSGRSAVRIAQAIVLQKIIHSAAAGRLTKDEASRFEAMTRAARTVTAVVKAEARAARIYWGRFVIRLEVRGKGILPPHWIELAGRPSALGPGPKRATRPINAMLNYAYGVTLGRVAAALHGAGACLSIGFLHADKPGRASLAYDALEPLRPIIDAKVAKWIASHKFTRGDFIRLSGGELRLSPSLAKCFGQETAPPQRDIAQAVQFMLGLIAEQSDQAVA